MTAFAAPFGPSRSLSAQASADTLVDLLQSRIQMEKDFNPATALRNFEEWLLHEGASEIDGHLEKLYGEAASDGMREGVNYAEDLADRKVREAREEWEKHGEVALRRAAAVAVGAIEDLTNRGFCRTVAETTAHRVLTEALAGTPSGRAETGTRPTTSTV